MQDDVCYIVSVTVVPKEMELVNWRALEVPVDQWCEPQTEPQVTGKKKVSMFIWV